ncbi:hypothetical protein ACET3X_007322 [Alternaria dauci]|uniref:Uncharacterized protein n=1 Tax=Alternaria dauci TaxID=48095 RepID=A0ABR3UBM4_9PLEO
MSTKEKDTVQDWKSDLGKPLQHRSEGSKAIWKTASQRLLLRNKDSIRNLDAERTIIEQMNARMELEKRQEPQMRSIQSIEEMAEEEKRADEEWNGIATQLAFDAQSPGVQEVKSVSFRHQRRPIANAQQ